MLNMVEIFPLCLNARIAFQVKVGFHIFHARLAEHILQNRHYKRAQPRIAVFRQNPHERQIYTLGLSHRFKQTENAPQGKPSAALLHSLAYPRQHQPERHDVLVLVANRHNISAVENEHKLVNHLFLHFHRVRHDAVEFFITFVDTSKNTFRLFFNKRTFFHIFASKV